MSEPVPLVLIPRLLILALNALINYAMKRKALKSTWGLILPNLEDAQKVELKKIPAGALNSDFN
jgi:hypothetical protein